MLILSAGGLQIRPSVRARCFSHWTERKILNKILKDFELSDPKKRAMTGLLKLPSMSIKYYVRKFRPKFMAKLMRPLLQKTIKPSSNLAVSNLFNIFALAMLVQRLQTQRTKIIHNDKNASHTMSLDSHAADSLQWAVQCKSRDCQST